MGLPGWMRRRWPGSSTIPGPAHVRRRRTASILVVATLAVGALAIALAHAADEDRARHGPGHEVETTPQTATTHETATLQPGATYRAFSADSWWNTPLPEDAPPNPADSAILDYLRTGDENGGGCLRLAGAGGSHWGQPIYWAEPSDPTYDVEGIAHGQRPPELDDLRIPASAEPAQNSDGTMIIYDLDRGYVTALTDAEYDAASDTWTATGATVTYVDSNGLHVNTGRSDDLRNTGTHRGNNGATMAVSWDMVQSGAIRHVLKVALGPEVSSHAVFPMVGSDGDYHGDDPAVPPEGLRLRLKPTLDLGEFNLTPQALVIAQALQDYGFYIGDSGGSTALKLENTRAEGRGQLWHLKADALCGLPFTPQYWDVLIEGYDPTE